ncbi:phosphate ABC transporter substrate-binding protein, PhoT family [Malonomonas rubra DSM 5091]|uniref:Phosphate-binding protein n=1 Tax=Malonomonas rubra DSM 5091 TaxID=1122189 RepID=A0A1M6H5Z8_MALRU|nr:phosphate ABC transporter substrate-binding protein [Malonomonas rubra]SHJ17655.1 phosphate ABC transporter substrate-binding protein, PhoT family [Malonomonas rubra DSM 5091]
MKTALKCLSLTLLALVVATTAMASPLKVDVNISDYVKVQGVAGNLNSVGSDTLNNMMTFWAEGFRKQYPNVNVQIEGKGSSTAPPALIEGTSQLGPMSRKMKSKESQKFEAKYGFKPTTIGVALDSLAVFINKDNPVNGLSLEEVDAIFSKTHKGGMADVTTWGQLGLSGEWANKPISLYGRNSASGTYGYFKSKALFKGDYKDSVKEQPGSASVVLGVTEDKAGIGYSGIGYKTSGVKAISLGKKKGDTQYEPTYANVMNGKYPLGRMLYINVVKEPNKPLPTLVKEFLKFALSKEGQEIVIKDGYLPLTADLVKKELAKLD